MTRTTYDTREAYGWHAIVFANHRNEWEIAVDPANHTPMLFRRMADADDRLRTLRESEIGGKMFYRVVAISETETRTYLAIDENGDFYLSGDSSDENIFGLSGHSAKRLAEGIAESRLLGGNFDYGGFRFGCEEHL